MMSYASIAAMSVDPYAALLKSAPPRDRRRHPLDPVEQYRTKFTIPPVISNPRTGSFDHRLRALNGQSWAMTLKEQQFENFVNEWQAEVDEANDLSEWRRLKNHEEEAIALWYDVVGDLPEYTTRMRTLDQEDMEYQCQRQKQIKTNLDPLTAWNATFTMKYPAEELKIRMLFKAGVCASMANTNNTTNLTASKKTSKQVELTQWKQEKHDNTSHLESSAEAGSSTQQKPEKKLNPSAAVFEYGPGKHREFLPTARLPTETTKALPASSKPAASAKITIRCPAEAKQAPARNIDQLPATWRQMLATKSTKESRTSKSEPSRGNSTSPQNSSDEEEETPPSSTTPSPTESPDLHDDGTAKYLPPDIRNRLQELERLQYGTVRPGERWKALKSPSLWKNPAINDMFERQLECVRKSREEKEKMSEEKVLGKVMVYELDPKAERDSTESAEERERKKKINDRVERLLEKVRKKKEERGKLHLPDPKAKKDSTQSAGECERKVGLGEERKGGQLGELCGAMCATGGMSQQEESSRKIILMSDLKARLGKLCEEVEGFGK